MVFTEFYVTYWNYYAQLEADFFVTEPYCAIDSVNNNAYSNKYLQLILSICGEIDTICKRFCKAIDGSLNTEKSGIDEYRAILTKTYPSLAKEAVIIQDRIYKDIKPWTAWSKNHNPHWWDTYNRLKHRRDEDVDGKTAFTKANQKTVLEALSALYIVLEYWAAHNFAIYNEQEGSYEMLRMTSSRLLLKQWELCYTGFMGQHFFETKPLREHLGISAESEATMSNAENT